LESPLPATTIPLSLNCTMQPMSSQSLPRIGRIPSLSEELASDELHPHHLLNSDYETKLLIAVKIEQNIKEIAATNQELHDFIQNFQKITIEGKQFNSSPKSKINRKEQNNYQSQSHEYSDASETENSVSNWSDELLEQKLSHKKSGGEKRKTNFAPIQKRTQALLQSPAYSETTTSPGHYYDSNNNDNNNNSRSSNNNLNGHSYGSNSHSAQQTLLPIPILPSTASSPSPSCSPSPIQSHSDGTSSENSSSPAKSGRAFQLTATIAYKLLQPATLNGFHNSWCTEGVNPNSDRRAILTSFAQLILREWVLKNITRPYPSKEDVAELGERAGITSKQVGIWFTNMRKRVWQPFINQLIKEEQHQQQQQHQRNLQY
jgi:hypothetical protein